MSILDSVESDVKDTLLEFQDQIADIAETGEVSTDFLNDLAGFDSYHHESHVDKSYDLKEAADILNELSDHEETDEGLWESLSPRDAISCQAAYTYGNAVMASLVECVEEKLNPILSGLDLNEAEREKESEIYHAVAWLWIYFHATKKFIGNLASLADHAAERLEIADFTPTLVLCDRLEELNECERFRKMARQLIADAIPDSVCEECGGELNEDGLCEACEEEANGNQD